MDDERWAFEAELEQDDDPPRSSAIEPVPEEDRISGQDQDGVVTVVVSPNADVLSVVLEQEWKQSVDPRGLHRAVAGAANAATIAALGRQVDDVAGNPPAMPTFGATPASAADESRLSTQDMLRLVEAATAELAKFTQRAATVVNRRITVESGGGHVRGEMTNGQIVAMEIDPSWLAQVRTGEIESEILDVLRQLRKASTPPGLADGPQGPAIAEIMGMLFDPHRMARRVGLEPSVDGEQV
ncbi:YbaB/EbfC family nucleoid-associated protein [Amycolatopsis umgeniensis]|uniref:DNA-binding protein YbaB n=1 Tax=Amycolatopsis umgeniensis TaxID=336628 RepID=A0A841BH06_9PSEU|nr:YbaB/EbfC family nucleoid-associated protein [Amycolatopsis umgeniensis]MBB5858055.1 DNA-binding protein YbaB [Amycolatopsis umgeniensis]